MWIFSLGVTLKQTISSKYGQIISDTAVKAGNDDNRIADVYHLSKSVNDVNNQYYCTIGKQTTELTTTPVTALDKIILAMCEPKSIHRASLMFLLDVSIKEITLLLLFYEITFYILLGFVIFASKYLQRRRPHKFCPIFLFKYKSVHENLVRTAQLNVLLRQTNNTNYISVAASVACPEINYTI